MTVLWLKVRDPWSGSVGGGGWVGGVWVGGEADGIPIRAYKDAISAEIMFDPWQFYG